MELAKDATLFKQAHCVSPTCSPSRAALLTGTYPHSNGMLGLAHRGFELNDYEKHLANFLKKNQYETALCGIQHEALVWRQNDQVAEKLGYMKNLTLESSHIQEEDMVFWDLANAKIVADYIKKSKEKRFFLSFGMHATHRRFPKEISRGIDERYVGVPGNIHEDHESRHDFAKFCTSAKFADDCVGIVIEALKEAGLYDNTMILFTTDHGIGYPFYKCNLKDTGTGVALVIRDPRERVQGNVIDALVSHLDVFPTICDIAGLEKPDWLEGHSLTDLMSGNASKVRDEVFGEINYHTSYEPVRSVRTQRYKYIRYFDDYNHINFSNIDDSIPKDFLMENGLRTYKKQMEAFYDLYYDPYEGNNLIHSKEHRELIADLRERLYGWQIETSDPLLDGHMPVPAEAKINKKECLSPGSPDKEDYEHLPE